MLLSKLIDSLVPDATLENNEPRPGDHWESPNGLWVVTWDDIDISPTARSGEIVDRDTFARQRWIYDMNGCRLERPDEIPNYVKKIVHYFGTVRRQK